MTLWQSLRLARDPFGFFERCIDRYGDVFTVRIIGVGNLVYVADPELLRDLFTGDPEALRAGEAYRFMEPVLGPNSLLLLDGEAHRRERRFLLPPFHGSEIGRHAELIAAITVSEIERWPRGEPFAMRPRMQAITLDAVLQAVFGIRDSAPLARLRTLIPRMLERSNLVIRMPSLRRDLGPLSPWRRFASVRAEVDQVLFEEIRYRRTLSDLDERDDVLSTLIRAHDELDERVGDRELRDELMTLLVAGHHTTGTVLAWAFERLTRSPDAIGRLVSELDRGEEAYLDAVVKETLRVRPVIFDVARLLKAPFTLNGYELPAGTFVMPAIGAVHLFTGAFEQAREFRPERFLEAQPDLHCWIPFGSGPRRCVGAPFAMMEMKVVLREVFSRLAVRSASAVPERPRFRNVTLVPGDGARVIVEERPGRRAAEGRRPSGAGRGRPTATTALSFGVEAASVRSVVGLLSDTTARAAILAVLGHVREGRIEFVEGDRRTAVGPANASLEARITVHEPRFWRALARGSASLGEAYGESVWDCDDLVALVRIAAREMPRLDRLRRPLVPLTSRLTRVPRNTPAGSRRNIAAHYDLGNGLFELFLDETLTYSCAYFETPDATLREAQEAKFERICTKLELTEEDELVEIGTGWGGFAVYAASRYGCRITTTTISREQHAFASDRVRDAGVEDRVTLLLQDYRDLRGRFDKLVSVEMVEAVGWQYLDTFFHRCSELLAPDGLMLLQVITMDDRAFEVEKATGSFMKTIIFPGCCLPSVEVIRSCVDRSTDMRALDIEDIGDHYPETLQRWRDLFLANEQQIAELGYDLRFRRIWHFYLAWCQAGFIERRTSDAQVLLAKPAYRRSPRPEPRETRVPEALTSG